MGNNEFVSVPRELIERIERAGVWPKEVEELRALLAQPAAQHQGGAVAWKCKARNGGTGRYSRIAGTEIEMLAFVAHYKGIGATIETTPLYTHADTGEVERLEAELAKLRKLHDSACAQLAERDAALECMTTTATSYKSELAERDALLRHFIEESEQDFVSLATVDRAKAALSASAEPSAQVAQYPNRLCHIDYTAHPYKCGCLKGDEESQRIYDEHCRAGSAEPSAPKCRKCGDTGVIEDKGKDELPGGEFVERGLVSCPGCEELRAPVERDERAEFEDCYAARWSHDTRVPHTAEQVKALRDGNGYGPDRHHLNGQWMGWQDRAALERKP